MGRVWVPNGQNKEKQKAAQLVGLNVTAEGK